MSAVLLVAAVYGTLVGGDFVPAPKIVSVGGYWRGSAAISEADANSLGYKLVVDAPPACASNEYAVATGWAEADGRIVREYTKALAPIAKPRYVVADLFYWVAGQGKAAVVKDYLVAAGFYEVALTTQTVEGGNETFAAILAAVKDAGIFTDAEIAAALAYALEGSGE